MLATEYDILTSSSIGMTSMTDWSLCDTREPSNRLDMDFSRAQMSPARPDTEYTPMLFALRYSKLVKITGYIAVLINSARLPKLEAMEALRQRVEAARNSLPPVLQFVHSEQSLPDPQELVLNRYRLKIVHHKTLCLLYRPYFGRGEYHQQHGECIAAAERLIETMIPMIEACLPGGRLAEVRLHICKHADDFNMAAMLLCSEIKRRLLFNDERVARVRSVMLQASERLIAAGVASPTARTAMMAVNRFLRHLDGVAAPEDAVNGSAPLHSQDAVCGLLDSEYDAFFQDIMSPSGWDAKEDPVFLNQSADP